MAGTGTKMWPFTGSYPYAKFERSHQRFHWLRESSVQFSSLTDWVVVEDGGWGWGGEDMTDDSAEVLFQCSAGENPPLNTDCLATEHTLITAVHTPDFLCEAADTDRNVKADLLCTEESGKQNMHSAFAGVIIESFWYRTESFPAISTIVLYLSLSLSLSLSVPPRRRYKTTFFLARCLQLTPKRPSFDNSQRASWWSCWLDYAAEMKFHCMDRKPVLSWNC